MTWLPRPKEGCLRWSVNIRELSLWVEQTYTARQKQKHPEPDIDLEWERDTFEERNVGLKKRW